MELCKIKWIKGYEFSEELEDGGNDKMDQENVFQKLTPTDEVDLLVYWKRLFMKQKK